MTKKKRKTDEDLELDSFSIDWDLIRSAASEKDEILTDTELYLPSLQGEADDATEAPDDRQYDIDMEDKYNYFVGALVDDISCDSIDCIDTDNLAQVTIAHVGSDIFSQSSAEELTQPLTRDVNTNRPRTRSCS